MKRLTLRWLAWSFGLLLPIVAAHSSPPPNIIFLITDDQGYGDLSAHGHPVLRTPNFDRLRRESVRFTDFHVSPTCAPTRAALLTGRHEFRNGVTHTILERERLAPGAITLPQVLKSAGYSTGIFGKWHLGDEAEYRPDRRGFDEVFIHGGGGIGQTYPGSCGDAPGNRYFDPAILHNGAFVKTRGYCTDVFFAEATKWIAAQKDRAPFFCWIATNAPHDPYIARPEDRALYADAGRDEKVANFFGMIHNIDENLGRLLARLDEWGIADNTIVVAMNDNGTAIGAKVFNAGMRGNKGSAWLGGTRAFSFWRWPGKFSPADCGALTAHVDFFRTIATLAGAKLPPEAEAQIEGRDLAPLLKNPAVEWPARMLFTHLGRWPKGASPETGKYRHCAVRDPRFTLVSVARAEKPAWELYDVRADPAQTRNLTAEHPGEVARLAAAYEAWWASLPPQLVNEAAEGPAVNPFKELFWKQFGGSPSAADLRLMNPARIREFGAPRPPTAPRPPRPAPAN